MFCFVYARSCLKFRQRANMCVCVAYSKYINTASGWYACTDNIYTILATVTCIFFFDVDFWQFFKFLREFMLMSILYMYLISIICWQCIGEQDAWGYAAYPMFCYNLFAGNLQHRRLQFFTHTLRDSYCDKLRHC